MIAQRGNYKFNNYGNSSILLSGNVTGSVDDIALTYYNPARLVVVDSIKFSFNAKGYEFNSLKISNLAGEQEKASDTDFSGIPSVAGGTFNLFDTRFAYCVLSKSKLNIGISYTSNFYYEDPLGLFEENSNALVKSRFTTSVKEEWVGLTWAKKIDDNLSLGVSGFVSIYKDKGYTNLDIANQNSDGSVVFYNKENNYKIDSYGLFLKIGANYHFPNFDIGLNINVPYLEVYQKGRYNYTKVIAGIDPETDQSLQYNFNDLKTERKEPFGVSLGTGISIGKNKVHLNVDYVTGLSSYNRISLPVFDAGDEEFDAELFEEKRKGVINFGAGVEIYMNDKFMSFVSFSSDYNSIEKSGRFFDFSDDEYDNNEFNENFIHLGGGVAWALKWGDVILGTTYTRGASKIDASLDFKTVNNINESVDVKYNRWQFVLGLEFPFLDDKLKDVLNNKK